VQQVAEGVYSIPCKCGRSYTGEIGRPQAGRLHEHVYNLEEGLLEKSELVQRAYEKGQRAGWDKARILETESNSRHTKYKDSAHIAIQLDNPILTFLPSGSLYQH
jgi:hypothetical protein